MVLRGGLYHTLQRTSLQRRPRTSASLEGWHQVSHELAALPPEKIIPETVCTALSVYRSLDVPELDALTCCIGQQLMRVLCSYSGWVAPVQDNSLVMLDHQDSTVLPLFATQSLLQDFAARTNATYAPLPVTLSRAMPPGPSGLCFHPGEPREELVLAGSMFEQTRVWQRTLELEAALREYEAKRKERGEGGCELLSLLGGAPYHVVTTQSTTDLARDQRGNVLVITSLDVAAACAVHFGHNRVRPITLKQLAGIKAEGELGYAFTVGGVQSLLPSDPPAFAMAVLPLHLLTDAVALPSPPVPTKP